MTNQQTLNRVTGGPKAGSLNDQRITVCKLCLFSIVVGQHKVWLTKPMGLSHEACAAKHGAP